MHVKIVSKLEVYKEERKVPSLIPSLGDDHSLRFGIHLPILPR